MFGKLADGGEVHISVKDDKPSFELTPAPPKAARKPNRKKTVKKPAADKPDAAASESKDDSEV